MAPQLELVPALSITSCLRLSYYAAAGMLMNGADQNRIDQGWWANDPFTESAKKDGHCEGFSFRTASFSRSTWLMCAAARLVANKQGLI